MFNEVYGTISIMGSKVKQQQRHQSFLQENGMFSNINRNLDAFVAFEAQLQRN